MNIMQKQSLDTFQVFNRQFMVYEVRKPIVRYIQSRPVMFYMVIEGYLREIDADLHLNKIPKDYDNLNTYDLKYSRRVS